MSLSKQLRAAYRKEDAASFTMHVAIAAASLGGARAADDAHDAATLMNEAATLYYSCGEWLSATRCHLVSATWSIIADEMWEANL